MNLILTRFHGAFLAGLLLIYPIFTLMAEDQLYVEDETDEVVEVQKKEEALLKPELLTEQALNISKSDLISVHGDNMKIRSGIMTIALEMKRDLYELTNRTYEGPLLPIVIKLYGKEGDKKLPLRMRTKIREANSQYKYQFTLDIHLAGGINPDQLQYHLMELFLYERGLSAGQQVANGETVLVRPWLIYGMLEALKIKEGSEDKGLYQAEVDHFEIIPLAKVLEATESDYNSLIGLEASAFRAISGALVNSILRQKKGRPNMEAYIAAFATFKGDEESLMRKHFPGMNTSSNSLEKWVGLEMAELGTANVTQRLSISETDARLSKLLTLKYHPEEEEATVQDIDISEYKTIIELDAAYRGVAIAGAKAKLERLSYRCFPEYEPLLIEYLQILGAIIIGEDRNIEARLAKLQETRQLMLDTEKRTIDYLNWFYITQSNQVSGDFIKYREISDQLDEEALRPPVDDHLKIYLQQVQELYMGR